MYSKISIQPLLIDKKKKVTAIQGRCFNFSLKITNESNNPSPEFNIKNIEVTSDKNLGSSVTTNGEFHVGILNPKESKIIDIEKLGVLIHGLVKIEANIVPKEALAPINVFQINSITGEISDHGNPNKLLDFFWIKSSNEYAQDKNTGRMIWFTAVIVFCTILQLFLIIWPTLRKWIK
jgi:hypothetical protein